MLLTSSRIHFYEMDDQPWFPEFLRARVQDLLTLMWTLHLPLLQSASPAQMAARRLSALLHGRRIHAVIDFCSGSGGPTPAIESALNAHAHAPVSVVMTDLFPHIPAWQQASRGRPTLSYVAASVDATQASAALSDGLLQAKHLRLFSLAFHHFDDQLAQRVLRDAVLHSDGLCVFELQSRYLTSLLQIFLMGPLLTFITPLFYWRSPLHLFFTYIIPILPFVMVVDGYVSALRTRTPREIMALLEECTTPDERAGWSFTFGSDSHIPCIGRLYWFAGFKE